MLLLVNNSPESREANGSYGRQRRVPSVRVKPVQEKWPCSPWQSARAAVRWAAVYGGCCLTCYFGNFLALVFISVGHRALLEAPLCKSSKEPSNKEGQKSLTASWGLL